MVIDGILYDLFVAVILILRELQLNCFCNTYLLPLDIEVIIFIKCDI